MINFFLHLLQRIKRNLLKSYEFLENLKYSENYKGYRSCRDYCKDSYNPLLYIKWFCGFYMLRFFFLFKVYLGKTLYSFYKALDFLYQLNNLESFSIISIVSLIFEPFGIFDILLKILGFKILKTLRNKNPHPSELKLDENSTNKVEKTLSKFYDQKRTNPDVIIFYYLLSLCALLLVSYTLSISLNFFKEELRKFKNGDKEKFIKSKERNG